MNKIAIITTRQNYKWPSMQEVFPALEKCWQVSVPESRIINVVSESLKEQINNLKYM